MTVEQLKHALKGMRGDRVVLVPTANGQNFVAPSLIEMDMVNRETQQATPSLVFMPSTGAVIPAPSESNARLN